MTGTIRIWLAAVLTGVLALATGLPLEARHAPVRSGNMVGGLFLAGSASDCRYLPDCAAWLRSRCDKRLSGRNPAWQTSIVNVADLADGTTPRRFTWRVDGPEVRTAGTWLGAGVGWGGVVVQFWRANCTELGSNKWRSHNPLTYRHQRDMVFSVPSAATWMTVATNDTVNIRWTLT